MYITCHSHSTAHIPNVLCGEIVFVRRTYSTICPFHVSIERLRAQRDPVCGVRAVKVVCMKSHRNTTCFFLYSIVVFSVCLLTCLSEEDYHDTTAGLAGIYNALKYVVN